MPQSSADDSFLRILQDRATNGKPIDQTVARESGLDVDYLKMVLKASWKVLEGSELFVPLRDLSRSHDDVTGNHWYRVAKAENLLDIRGLRFGGERKAIIQRYPQWAPTLRLERFTGGRVDDISSVEVFLTVDCHWIVYRGSMLDSPNAGFLRQFRAVGELCGYLNTLELGAYKFETPSAAIALADQLIAFVSQQHQLLRKRQRNAARLLDEQYLIRKYFDDWRPTFQ